MVLSGFSMDVSLFESATKEGHAVATAEVAVETVHFLIGDNEILSGMPLGKAFRFGTGRRRTGDGSTKFRHDADEGSLQ